MSHSHKFHIPVLGLCYTIDTALKVAKYGISSVLSIVEDELIEDMRAYHALRNGIVFEPIPETDPDHRAKRITAYLNLLQELVNAQIKELKALPFETGSDIQKYFDLLPDTSLKKMYANMMAMNGSDEKVQLQQQLKQAIVAGDIDVNIMAKLDNYSYTESGERMPDDFCDAVAALRGFANSKLSSSVVFSAGYNPRLFNYLEQYEDFYPDANGHLIKKIILKVSDYRSALVQGKLLAKKGLWVSEFRIESGLNCGGHAFPTEGILMGPILEEFKNKREQLAAELFDLCNDALVQKGKKTFSIFPIQKVSAQGGVGTHEEQQFLLEYFQLDSVGWGSPFLLVPEVTNVDEITLQKLANAIPQDYFLSDASPLGVPFHNFRNSSSEDQRKQRIAGKRAGSPCYKKYLTSNTEFTPLPICTASRQYQELKKNQLDGISFTEEIKNQIEKLEAKDCLCEGLTSSARLKNKMKLPHKLSAVTICPGPNLQFFSGIFSLKEMVDHIYGRTNIGNALYRPQMFINELKLYVDYLKKEIKDTAFSLNDKQIRYFQKFRSNLLAGIAFYKKILASISNFDKTLEELSFFETELFALLPATSLKA
ncbi:MAG TPA: hypothetical protein VNT20_09095 [Flavisolibacter sp.]|jgi:hypothetical protein|nr:hypothetical protein [Flavisolibacter sp.]